jgi:hypothetical protein
MPELFWFEVAYAFMAALIFGAVLQRTENAERVWAVFVVAVFWPLSVVAAIGMIIGSKPKE